MNKKNNHLFVSSGYSQTTEPTLSISLSLSTSTSTSTSCFASDPDFFLALVLVLLLSRNPWKEKGRQQHQQQQQTSNTAGQFSAIGCDLSPKLQTSLSFLYFTKFDHFSLDNGKRSSPPLSHLAEVADMVVVLWSTVAPGHQYPTGLFRYFSTCGLRVCRMAERLPWLPQRS